MTRYLFGVALSALCAADALAYVGPGLGIGAIGALIGLIMTVALAIVGLFWYPIKRRFKRKSRSSPADPDGSIESNEK